MPRHLPPLYHHVLLIVALDDEEEDGKGLLVCVEGAEAALSRADCDVLRKLLDREWRALLLLSERPQAADFKLQLSFAELAQHIGQTSAQRLAALARGSFNKILLRRCDADTDKSQHGAGTIGKAMCIGFHLDVSQQVLQVALNDDCEYSGGRLIFLTAAGNGNGNGNGDGKEGKLLVPKRAAGSYTLHNRYIVHGVSEHRAGLRYGLFFIQERMNRVGIEYDQ